MTESAEDASNVLSVKSGEDEPPTEHFIQQSDELEVTGQNMSDNNTLQVSLRTHQTCTKIIIARIIITHKRIVRDNYYRTIMGQHKV